MSQSRLFIFFSHILGLLFFFSIPIIFLGGSFQLQNFVEVITSKQYLIFYGCYIFLYYFNSFWLIPRLYLQKKFFAYTGILLLLFTGVYFLKPFDHLVSYESRQSNGSRRGLPPRQAMPPSFDDNRSTSFPKPSMQPPASGSRPPMRPTNQTVPLDIVSLFLFVMIVAFNLAVETSRQWRSTQKQALQAEADKVNAQFSFLKAQINPHFLFNTLNNIYSLVVTKNENAGPAILKLSNIMRYVTDEVNANFVFLQQEADCIRDYIELQRLRLGKKVELDFSISGNLENKTIAPLVLVTFIENVFKYGISNHEKSPIAIHIKAEADRIIFFSQNNIFPNRSNLDRPGVGIANTRERLKYLYPRKHTLNITTENGLYTVQLTLLF